MQAATPFSSLALRTALAVAELERLRRQAPPNLRRIRTLERKLKTMNDVLSLEEFAEGEAQTGDQLAEPFAPLLRAHR